MDKPRYNPTTGELTDEYAHGVDEFMTLASNNSMTSEYGKMYCPCVKCRNHRLVAVREVWYHLCRNRFMPGYKVWYSHGETDLMVQNYGSTSDILGGRSVRLEESTPEVDENLGMVHMVNDAFRENIASYVHDGSRDEQPNIEARRFFDMLNASKQPLFEGCSAEVSRLSQATDLLSMKMDYNLPEELVDRMCNWGMRMIPAENNLPGTYYEIQKLVGGIGLPYQMIDVCIDNCMIYWRKDENRLKCRFCHKPRYQETSGRVPVPYKRMWYLPIAERLKRLYLSKRTAKSIRWHAEHSSDGKITHPSDAKAWKHFQNCYPTFANEARNVYLGLSTDGFNPFGKHGRQYSLWLVILTPYNLPPSMCMRREFLFLSILVPGPEHSKKSLDIFLQPLIHELKMLWKNGVEGFDVSVQQNFVMRAVLIWTISDFPAYGMLSGWTTHGRMACPLCQDNTDAFQLKHGRKTSWFDCHRRWLPHDHPYRKSRTLFWKNKKISKGPPPEIDGIAMLNQMSDFDVDSTVLCGGNGHEQLHVNEDGSSLAAAFWLDQAGKEEFFDWIKHSVKFTDSYASNLRNCVDRNEGKLSGMKSHDCHVFMQRLPFAFKGLLPNNVHKAIAGIGAFFRDICARTLTEDGIRNLDKNIPEIICELEKIFPPAFFDVMEHLPIHLPKEAELGGPVQYRWMYPFERFMFHLKKKVGNLAKVEGSIVVQSINEETSHFSSYYFPSNEIPLRKGRRSGLGKIVETDPATAFFADYNEDLLQQNEELKAKVDALEASKAETEERLCSTQGAHLYTDLSL
ncbi:unnamed protein product [Microthlaspi erraticum]|uniref:DUF4218 domain-containing protein n=1 Tax=Microthlaspi erraticum TaxID=1685480 RepID=A0A6D2HPD2_9BRAS|nr:unnamed protein product [Microthlaspi erraticum]